MAESVGKKGSYGSYYGSAGPRSVGSAVFAGVTKGKSKSGSVVQVGRRFKSREMVFLKKRTQVEGPETTSQASSSGPSQSESTDFIAAPTRLAGSTLPTSFGSISSSPMSSASSPAQQKTPFCPYQYLYYTMLLEYTTDKSFRILSPHRRGSHNKI